MKKNSVISRSLIIFLAAVVIHFGVIIITGCGGSGGNRGAGETLIVEEVAPDEGGGSGSWGTPNGVNTGDKSGSSGSDETVADGGSGGGSGSDGNTSGNDNSFHSIFRGEPGVSISSSVMGAIDPDPTGHTVNSDYDGDGIPNSYEIVSNPYVADYPRIVTRISAPITMEIRVSQSTINENHSETVEDTDVQNTIANSMESRQYTQTNLKTTPYVTKESYSNSESHSESYGESSSFSGSVSSDVGIFGVSGGGSVSASGSRSRNESLSDSFAKSRMTEKTVFEDVSYVDNLDRSGVEFKNDTVQRISRNYRKSKILKSTEKIGPNDGYVRAALFIKNLTVNIPVRVSNVICTLSFKTPAGEFLPVKTFKLRNEDYSEFNQEVYGGEELGPYTIEVANLNTYEVMKALKNGYVPQIHIVSYDMHRVEDSNYNPGVDNLKIVEETAKGRTAVIKIAGTNMREIFRVAAFDVDENGNISPGISLKKALFNIFRSRTGTGEQWEDSQLTVSDAGLKWKTGSSEHTFNPGITGNSWDMFETYIKEYRDQYNRTHKIETIKRIGSLKKYNPFNIEDNPAYNPNELLSEEEIYKMKYFIIFHNGRYFEGDINDPIWAGERFEIICFDVGDFKRHFQDYYYTPAQSGEPFYLDTRWNRLNQDDYFKRARYIGKVIKRDVIHLEIDLAESRFLFDPSLAPKALGVPGVNGSGKLEWTDNIFNYTFQPDNAVEKGIPGEFSHRADGGINNITVEVDESKFAGFYEISFGVEGTPRSSRKTVKVTANDLKKNAGKVIITRNTLDITGNPVGFINGGSTYDVYVKAVGNAYGYDVYTSSLSNGKSSAKAVVSNAGEGMPGSFSYRASGLLNSIDIRIQEGLNTEYYVIEYQGPYNYGSDPPVTSVIGHPGINKIAVDNPSGEVKDPGLYRVNVFAVNNNNIENGVSSAGGEQFILVNFERYRDQKVYAPSISTEYFGLTAIDLEVNFNNGDGWYRLKLSNSDTAGREIDCRYTSYIEQDRQKFHIFFRPPSGIDDPMNPTSDDVFRGGREEVDVYIRTAAENRYRDTFWPKKSGSEDYYVLTESDVYDFINFWVNSPYSDASYIEDTLAGNYTGDFSLSSSNINNYFFSPLERRIYRIRALLTDKIITVDTSPIDEPVYSASTGEQAIEISGLDSVYGELYRIYWRRVDGLTQEQINGLENDFFLAGWDSSENIADNNYTINELVPFSDYVVAVKAYNMYGKVSKPVFLKEGGNIVIYRPYLNYAPEKITGMSLNMGADGRTILVSNIYVPDENVDQYQVQWKHADYGGYIYNWSSTNQATINADGVNPESYLITGLNYWDRYIVRARARTRAPVNRYGDWSDEMMIETVKDGSIGLSVSSNVDGISDEAWKNSRPDSLIITLQNISLPPNTSSYTISYSLDLYYSEVDYDCSIIDSQTCTASASHYSETKTITINNTNNTTQIQYVFQAPRFVRYEYNTPVSYAPDIHLALSMTAKNIYGEETSKNFNFRIR